MGLGLQTRGARDSIEFDNEHDFDLTTSPASSPCRRCRASATRSGRIDFDAAECVARHIEAGGITPLPLRRQRVPLSRHARTSTRSCSAGWPAFPDDALGDPERRPVVRPRHRSGAAAPPPSLPPCDGRCPAAIPRDAAGLEAGMREIADAAGHAADPLPQVRGRLRHRPGGRPRRRRAADRATVCRRRSSTRSSATIPRHDPYLDGLLRRVDRAPRDQRHGRAAGGRRTCATSTCPDSRPAPAASRRAVQRAVRRLPRRRTGRAPRAHSRAVHAARGSARRVGAGARAPSRHRARRRSPPPADSARSCPPLDDARSSTTLAPRSRARFGSATRMSRGPRLTAGRPAQPPLVRQGRPALVRPPLARQAGGLQPRRTSAASRSSRILNTWSDANPCHTHFRLRAEEVKRGVWQAGGFPMEIPLLDARRDAS